MKKKKKIEKVPVREQIKKILNFAGKFRMIFGILLIFFVSYAFRNAVAERDLQKLEAAAGCKFAPFLVRSEERRVGKEC